MPSSAVFGRSNMRIVILVQDGGDGGAVSGVGILLLIGYFIPTIVAYARSVPNKGSVAVVNFFLGWTVIGWIIALAMAARSRGVAQTGPGRARSQAAHQTRECPFCRSNIRADASVCPHCRRESDPWEMRDGRWWAKGDDGEWWALGARGWEKPDATLPRERPVWPPPPPGREGKRESD